MQAEEMLYNGSISETCNHFGLGKGTKSQMQGLLDGNWVRTMNLEHLMTE